MKVFTYSRFLLLVVGVFLLFSCDESKGAAPSTYKDYKGYALAEKDGRCGLIDYNGNELIPIKYTRALPLKGFLIAFRDDSKYAVFDANGKQLTGFDYDYISYLKEGMYTVVIDEQEGIIDAQGKDIIPCAFSDISSIAEGYAVVVDKDNDRYLIDAAGQRVAVPENAYLHNEADVENGYFLTHESELDRLGIVDKDGQVTVPAIYRTVSNIDNRNKTVVVSDSIKKVLKLDASLGREVTYIYNIHGLVDYTNNKTILPFEYEYIGVLKDNRMAVCKDEKYGYMDSTYQVVIPLEYESASDFDNGFAVVGKNGQYGVVNKEGKVLLDFEYSNIWDYLNGQFVCAKESLGFGAIDTQGNELLPIVYMQTYGFCTGLDGIAAVFDGSKWGCIDRKGQTVIPFDYDYLQPLAIWND